MKRVAFVFVAGLIGLLLGIGLSLLADAIAGDELSDPVPLGIATADVRVPPSSPRDRPTESASPRRDDDHDGASTGPASTESPSSSGPTPTHSDDASSSHDDDSHGGSEGPDGDD